MSDVLLIARREITEKLRSKAFLIVNGVLLVVIIGATILPGVLGGDDEPLPLGVVGEEAAAVGEVAVGLGGVFSEEVTVQRLDDRAEATQAVRDGDVAAALTGPETVIVDGRLTGDVRQIIRTARQAQLLDDALDEAGVSAEQRRTLATPPQLDVVQIGEDDGPEFGPSFIVGLVAIGALYGLLIFYGQMVAQGIVQEKSSRVIEVLLATVRPTQLLGGKLLGLGVLGFAQVLVLAVVAGAGLVLTDTVALEEGAPAVLASVIGWYVLGYGLYATLFAFAGAVVSSVEDLQAASTPVIVVLIGSLFLVQFSIQDPSGTAATIASYMPFSAPLAQPLRFAVGEASALGTVVSIAISVATIAVLVPVAARVHAGGALVTRGRISIREALRTAEDRRARDA